MDWQKLITTAFHEKDWELLKKLPKNHTYQVWIALKSVSFFEKENPEEISKFLKFIKKNNIELKVSEGSKKIDLEMQLIHNQNFTALNNLALQNYILDPVKILSNVQDNLNKVSTSKMQHALVSLLSNFSKDTRISEKQWKSFVPYLMIFSLIYGENDVLDGMIKKDIAKYTPQEELIFSKPPVLANPAYIYTNIACRFVENHLIQRNKSTMARFVNHLNMLAQHCSFYNMAIAADGHKIANAFENIDRIKNLCPPEARALFESISLNNFIVAKEEVKEQKVETPIKKKRLL